MQKESHEDHFKESEAALKKHLEQISSENDDQIAMVAFDILHKLVSK